MVGSVDEVTDLLQHLIRNGCVNDGTPASGHEIDNADLLSSYLGTRGLDHRRFESAPGRGSVVSWIEGSDPTAPSLLLMGHTDVVPVNADRWQRDPFGGELVDGVVWGRGAVDMLSTTAEMAAAFKHLAHSGFRPRGSLGFFGVADEEALGTYGAGWMLEHEPDAVRADNVLTEFGGFRMPLPSTSGPKYPVMIGEKGSYWCRIVVKGTPGHGSMPFRTDNALVKAAEVVRRIAEYVPRTTIVDAWRGFVEQADLLPEVREQLLDPAGVQEFARAFPDLGMARMVYSCTHTTFAPTVVHGGVKTNVIPDVVALEVDIRTLPGHGGEEVRDMLREALGDLADQVEITAQSDDRATASPQETPLYRTIASVTSRLVPGALTVPFLVVGATDARFFRRAGAVAYGAGLFSERIAFQDFASMFHGDDERIDQESLHLGTEFFEAICRQMVG